MKRKGLLRAFWFAVNASNDRRVRRTRAPSKFVSLTQLEHITDETMTPLHGGLPCFGV